MNNFKVTIAMTCLTDNDWIKGELRLVDVGMEFVLDLSLESCGTDLTAVKVGLDQTS